MTRITIIGGVSRVALVVALIEGPFRDALKNASRLTVVGDKLELLDAAGKRLATFVAGSKPSEKPASAVLPGTSWQVVKFQSMDDTTLTPDDRAKYTIETWR